MLFSLVRSNWTHWMQAPVTYLQTSYNHPFFCTTLSLSASSQHTRFISCHSCWSTCNTSSSLRITDHSFRCASPCLWNQLHCQPHLNLFISDSPLSMPVTSSSSVDSLLSSSVTPSLFHSRLNIYLFQWLSSSLRTQDWLHRLSPRPFLQTCIGFCFRFFFLFMAAVCGTHSSSLADIIFLSCFFLFFPRLISAVADWMSTILLPPRVGSRAVSK